MSVLCPVYKNNYCLLKKNFTLKLNSKIFEFDILPNDYNKNCHGVIESCSFAKKTENIEENISENIKVSNTETQLAVSENSDVQQDTISKDNDVKISIHLYENPYLIKSDVLVYPTNIVLTVDDPLLHRMSRGVVQSELDKFPKPIKMGSVYITSNGGDLSKVQSKKIYHAVVAGESRLVNEEDIKSSIRKSLHLALQNKAKNILMMPPDCGTLDINDTARVHLSSIKTFLQAEKNSNFKNIFIVMSDQESYDTYLNYYKRIFKQSR